MKALSVVAHSDDHLLWMGGTILRLNYWKWHILSLCKSHNNEDFKPKKDIFNISCSKLGADIYNAKDLSDYQSKEFMQKEQLQKILEEIQVFADNYYDLIFTHSIKDSCEYGFHANHVEVRDAVNQLINDNLIKTKGVLHFCYKSGGYQKPVIADLDNADYKIELSPEEINIKKTIKKILCTGQKSIIRWITYCKNGENYILWTLSKHNDKLWCLNIFKKGGAP